MAHLRSVFPLSVWSPLANWWVWTCRFFSECMYLWSLQVHAHVYGHIYPYVCIWRPTEVGIKYIPALHITSSSLLSLLLIIETSPLTEPGAECFQLNWLNREPLECSVSASYWAGVIPHFHTGAVCLTSGPHILR